ncbi:putative protease [Actinoplanes sp. SE50]|uniref:CPBP family intramembrane glutamic endopeptidase n=1 Tax=unclassified Actinoplanes TaxID=2626549 RepID=UPI00023ECA0F|nr:MULTISPECIES: CPBP family intramembrane glutamic endopeptidase [unclassified Actinoplanes]AEV87094.1 putative protease [Actinoplanes sp. SE50/110]ATO85492.1 putative protease [Actinoplanes sp. SE50]SLM02904.1 putative protease [Actinoplanes sp. SE50/110]
MILDVKAVVRAHPVLSAVVVTVLWHAALYAAVQVLPRTVPEPSADLVATVANLVAAGVPLAAVALLRWWRQAGLGRPVTRRLRLTVPVLLVNLTYAAPGLTGGAARYAATASLCLAVGVSEEMLSRGVVQRMLWPLGRTRATVGVAVLFGLGHALSAVWFSRPWDDSVVQVVTTTAFGFAYAALRWHLGSIWPLVVLHAMDDFFQLRSPGAAPLWWQAAVVLVFVGYGGWLLRQPGSATPPAAS